MSKRKVGQVGRVSYIHDRARVERLLQAIRAGNWLTTAAKIAGLHHQTVRGWIAKGEQAREGEMEGKGVPAAERIYLSFLEEYELADSMAEATVVAALMVQARSAPQASVGMLKMRWPKNWKDQPVRVEFDMSKAAEQVAAETGMTTEAVLAGVEAILRDESQ